MYYAIRHFGGEIGLWYSNVIDFDGDAYFKGYLTNYHGDPGRRPALDHMNEYTTKYLCFDSDDNLDALLERILMGVL